MKAKKVLFITSEMLPFVAESHNAKMGRFMPQYIQEKKHEIRSFTPKWGTINERRNQLHEVIRLSGMNLIIDETDHPLIIKVASLPSARMQIYFIDNDDYFHKRLLTADEDGKEYEDNGERAIFYARGVLETVKKLNWIPDVIHCHGWMAAMTPFYIKNAFADEPSFANTKVVMSVTAPEFTGTFEQNFAKLAEFRDSKTDLIKDICGEKCGHTELLKIGVKFSDAVIIDSEDVKPEVIEYAKQLNLPILGYQGEDFKNAYSDFYETLMD